MSTLTAIIDNGKRDAVQRYWDQNIHDLSVSSQPVGSPGFFEDLETYRYDKLDYLPKSIDFRSMAGRRILEVGCGIGTDLVRFARGGATITGIDLAPTAVKLAHLNVEQNGLTAGLSLMDGEQMGFGDETYDIVYAHGVLQYAANPKQIVSEMHRVLKPGGLAIIMVYNRNSWLNGMSKATGVALEHADAPCWKTYSIGEFRALLAPFSAVSIVPERFPVATRIHTGLKATLYNDLFVGTFNRLPQTWIRPFGWHLMALAEKA